MSSNTMTQPDILQESNYTSNENSILTDEFLNYYNIPDRSDNTSIKIIKEGEYFIADTKNSESICRLDESKVGNAPQFSVNLTYPKNLELPQFKTYTKDITTAKILSFDENSVSVMIYYDDHETKRIFDNIFKESLEENGLLIENGLFNITTQKHKGGFSIDVEPYNDFTEFDELIIEELKKVSKLEC